MLIFWLIAGPFVALMYIIIAMLAVITISDGWDNASTRLRILAVVLAIIWPVSLFVASAVGLLAGIYVLWFRRPPC